MRGATRRTWIKLHIDGMLFGSVRYQLSPAERSVWVDLICLAGLNNNPGHIQDNDERPFPHVYIADRLHIGEKLLESTLEKCKEEGRITEDGNGIHITNWKVYQSEYQRQKPYREKGKDEEREGTGGEQGLHPNQEPHPKPALTDAEVDAYAQKHWKKPGEAD